MHRRIPILIGAARDRLFVCAIAALTFGAAAACSVEAAQNNSPSNVSEGAQKDAADSASNPSPQFAPEDVVKKQMQALSSTDKVEARIERCYRFASPANRAHTGPIERFSQMVQAPEYAVLFNAKHFLVGRATQKNDEAHVLVTVVDPAGELTLFRFFLSKQSKAPEAGCWMTDAVIRVGTVKLPDNSSKSPNDGRAI